jgi:hypothetical protein
MLAYLRSITTTSIELDSQGDKGTIRFLID